MERGKERRWERREGGKRKAMKKEGERSKGTAPD